MLKVTDKEPLQLAILSKEEELKLERKELMEPMGNSGDPLGGNGDGDSKIGVDRKLISYIPGTMGKGGEQPSHNCTANGTITISYTVDKAGNVISARRSSGILIHVSLLLR